MNQLVRIGIVGLGNNTRNRHLPGFQAIDGVEIVSVCNRRRESTQQAAVEFGIPKTHDDWESLVRDEAIDAVMVGTWPNLHGPVTLAALKHGKHVLVEARMAAGLNEAQLMLDAAKAHPDLVTQIVPSPFGLRAGVQVRQMLSDGFLGELREFVIRGANSDFANLSKPLHWRQSRELSGINMLALGILHETLTRWIPDPVRVLASTHRFNPHATRPDSVHVLTELSDGARGLYHLSGVTYHADPFAIELYGTKGTIKYDLKNDRLYAGRSSDQKLIEVIVPPEKQESWRVEADFVEAIRGGARPRLTDFETGVRYMAFTDAVERSANESAWISF